MTAVNQAQQEVQKKLDIRDRARRDKMFLATEVLGYVFQPDVHTELFACYIPFDSSKTWRLQSEVKNRIVLWPRGHYKTTSIIVEIIQMIINNPDVRILIMQGSRQVTQTLLHQIKAHFIGQSPNSKFREYFPEFCGDRLGNVDSFTTPARKQKQLAQATVTVASPRTIKTGQHYDAGFFDDLINDQNYRSPKLLEKVRQDFFMCIPLIDPGCYTYVTGTRYAFGDLYEGIIRGNENGEWIVTVKTCWTDDGKEVRFPARTLPDGNIIGFTREQLLSIQRNDPGMFASQYLNQPAFMGNQLFSEALMDGSRIMPDLAPHLSQGVLFIDLAGSQSELQSDDSVILCGKTDHLGNMYVVDGIGDTWSSTQLAFKVIEMSLKHRPLRVMIEHTPSATYFTDFLRVICRDKGIILPIEFIKVSNQKDAKAMRITPLEGYIRGKRLRFFVGLPCWDKMKLQFTTWPKAAYGHDDYPDTVGLMAQVFSAAVGPVIPLSAERHPLLKAMELQGNDITRLVMEQVVRGDNEMGDDFTC